MLALPGHTTGRAVFPHQAFTKTEFSEQRWKESSQPSSSWWKSSRTRAVSVSGRAAGEDGWGETGSEMSKTGGVDSSIRSDRATDLVASTPQVVLQRMENTPTPQALWRVWACQQSSIG